MYYSYDETIFLPLLSFLAVFFLSVCVCVCVSTFATAAHIIFILCSAYRLLDQLRYKNLNHVTSQASMIKRYKKRGNVGRLFTRKQAKDANLDVILSCFEVRLV